MTDFNHIKKSILIIWIVLFISLIVITAFAGVSIYYTTFQKYRIELMSLDVFLIMFWFIILLGFINGLIFLIRNKKITDGRFVKSLSVLNVGIFYFKQIKKIDLIIEHENKK